MISQGKIDRRIYTLQDLSLLVWELGREQSLGTLAVRAPGLGEDDNLVLRDGVLRNECKHQDPIHAACERRLLTSTRSLTAMTLSW